MMRYDAQIVVRCTQQTKRTVDQWAKQNHAKPGEVTRRILEAAFGIKEDLPLPPGLKRLLPTQGAPGKA